MKTIRRIYFYLLTFIGLQLIVWGLFTLLSGIWSSADYIGLKDVLPTGLSLVLIGLPVFMIHFRVIQNDAASDPEEDNSLVRAIFLYLTQATALGAIAVGSINMIDHLISVLAPQTDFELSTLLDQISIILLNALVWYLLSRYLIPDEDYYQKNENHRITRRVYRYTWLVIAIAITAISIQGQLSTMFRYTATNWLFNSVNLSSLDISLILVWTCIWAWTWNMFLNAYHNKEESQSSIRHILNLIITIISMAVWIISVGYLLYGLLDRLFESEKLFLQFFKSFNIELSVFIPFFFLWLYFKRQLSISLEVLQNEKLERLINRIHANILSLAGNIITLIGTWAVLSWMIDKLFGITPSYGGIFDQLSRGITLLVVGLPLWILNWRKLQAETNLQGTKGFIARKATLRRVYLYIFVFGAVIGTMITAGSFFYNLLFIILGRHEPNFAYFVISNIVHISIFVAWLLYHMKVMGNDNKILKVTDMETEVIQGLILKTPADEALMDLLHRSITQKHPSVQIQSMLLSDNLNDEVFNQYQIILISTTALLSLSDINELIDKFEGKVLLVPTTTQKLIPIANTNQTEITNNILSVINQLKEGAEIKIHTRKSALYILAYVIGGLIALNIIWQLLMGITMAIAN
jgi:hypothetical protein